MYSERHVTQFEYLTQPCSSMKSRTEYGEVGGAAGENSSCTHCHSSVCAENLLARRKDGSSLDWFALPSMCELSRLEYVHSHPMQNTRMNRGAGQLWEGFSAWLVEDELQREYARRRGRGGSANIGYTRTCALRSDTAAQPPVDLSALREMYPATVTLSIVYSQEVCGTEEKVGGRKVTRSGIQNDMEKNLPIVVI